jgi:hypothetical protein
VDDQRPKYRTTYEDFSRLCSELGIPMSSQQEAERAFDRMLTPSPEGIERINRWVLAGPSLRKGKRTSAKSSDSDETT